MSEAKYSASFNKVATVLTKKMIKTCQRAGVSEQSVREIMKSWFQKEFEAAQVTPTRARIEEVRDWIEDMLCMYWVTN